MNEKGCLQAGEEWLEHNLLTVAGIAVGIAFLQVHLYVLFKSHIIAVGIAFLQVLTKILTPTHIIAVGTHQKFDHHHNPNF